MADGRNRLATISLFLAFFASGLSFAMIPPCLDVLRQLVHTDNDGIATVFTARSGGYLMGAICAAVLFASFSRMSCLITASIAIAITTMSTPYATSLMAINLLSAINGIASGCADTAITVSVLNLWSGKCGPFVQGLYCCYALGVAVAPLIVAPFLNHDDGNLKQPFAIASFLVILPVIALIVTCVKYPITTQDVPEVDEIYDNIRFEHKLRLSVKYKWKWLKAPANREHVSLIICCLMIALFYSGLEVIYFEFMPYYVKKIGADFSPPITDQQASYMYSTMNYAYTAARGVAIILAVKFKGHIFIFCDLILILVASLILIIFGGNGEQFQWVGNVIIGLGFGTMYPSVYAFVEERMEVTNILGALSVFFSGITAIIYPLFLGSLVTKYPPCLIWLVVISVLITLAVFSIAYFCFNGNVNRVKRPSMDLQVM